LSAAKLAARTAPRGAREIVHASAAGTIAEIRVHKRTLLVTYKRDGHPVPTPVWAAEAGGLLYVRSERTAGKIKRLSRDSRVLVAPCTMRGRPLGLPLRARARVLSRAEEPVAERTLAGRYGLGRALFEWTMDVLRIDMCYLEIAADSWGEEPTKPAPTNEGGAIAR
jgi:uncharacterized protein